MSQWWPAEFAVDGAAFHTAEHYMIWRKAKLFGDQGVAEKILAAQHPGEAKALGRQVDGFDEKLWEAQRYSIVVAANTAKFGQHEALREFVLRTGDWVLVEASLLDRARLVHTGRIIQSAKHVRERGIAEPPA
nr:NADAR family protein [Nocardia nova]